MDRPSDIAVRFEAVKASMRQDKHGFSLVLVVHPDDVPEALMRDWVGTRYVVAMVALTDEDKPRLGHTSFVDRATEEIHSPDEQAAVSLAGALCREEGFQRWLYVRGFASAPDEEEATKALRDMLKISSRSELASNAAAREDFHSIYDAYRKAARL